jgi:hypothetical protein
MPGAAGDDNMPEMSPEERLLCALNHEEPDRVPIYDLVDSVGVFEHYSGLRLTQDNAEQVIPLALSRVIDHTRIWMPGEIGVRTDGRGFTYERQAWFNEWQTGKPYGDLDGLVAWVKSDIERLESDISRPESDRRFDAGAHLHALEIWRDRFAPTTIPAATAAEALTDAYIDAGVDWFTYLDADNPALVDRWVEALHQASLRRLAAQAGCRAISPIAWVFADMAFKGRLMFSPRYLRERGIFRRIAEFCEIFHGYGLKVIFHSDGYLLPVIPDLIAAGVDAVAPVETGSGAGMDLASLKARFGSQVAFCGGIDVQEVLQAGTPDDVRRATLDALAAAGPGGGLILGSSSEELFDTIPAENIITMWETTRECGRYPIGKYFPANR